MDYNEEYKQHQIIVNEGGSSNGYPTYNATINGWLNKNKSYEDSVKVGFEYNRKVPAELIVGAKEAIDAKLIEIEQEAIFKRKSALNHFDYFKKQLESRGVQENVDQIAANFTTALLQTEIKEFEEKFLERLRRIEVSVDKIGGGLYDIVGNSIAEVLSKVEE